MGQSYIDNSPAIVYVTGVELDTYQSIWSWGAIRGEANNFGAHFFLFAAHDLLSSIGMAGSFTEI